MEREKKIEEIKKMRNRLKISQYEEGFLESLNEDELENIYQRNLALVGKNKKENGKKRLILPFIGVFLIITIATSLFLLRKNENDVKYSINPENPEEIKETPIKEENILNNIKACMCDEEPERCESPGCYCDPLCQE